MNSKSLLALLGITFLCFILTLNFIDTHGAPQESGRRKSPCQTKWEECMDGDAGRNKPTAGECDDEVKRTYGCIIGATQADDDTGSGKEGDDGESGASKVRPRFSSSDDSKPINAPFGPGDSEDDSDKKSKVDKIKQSLMQNPDDVRRRDKTTKEKERIFIKEDVISIEEDKDGKGKTKATRFGISRVGQPPARINTGPTGVNATQAMGPAPNLDNLSKKIQDIRKVIGN